MTYQALQRQRPAPQRAVGGRGSTAQWSDEDETSRVLRLQEQAGNAAVTSLLASGRTRPGEAPAVQRDGPAGAAPVSDEDATAPAPSSGGSPETRTQTIGTRVVSVDPAALARAASAHGDVADAARDHVAEGGGSPDGAATTGPATPAPTTTPGTPTPAADAPRSTLLRGDPIGVDLTLSGGANIGAVDSYNPAGGTGPRRARWGGQAGAGDLSAGIGGAIVLRGRYLWREGGWHFIYEPTFGASVSLTGMTTDDGRVHPAAAFAVSASADLMHWGSGRTDLHMLNTAVGLGWGTGADGLVPSVTVTPLAVERHLTDSVSVMLSVPVTVTPGDAGNANVAVGGLITLTWNARQGGVPGGN
jgi:hypothetical protein